LVPGQEPVLPRRKPEEEIVLLQPLDISAGRRKLLAAGTREQLALIVEGFVAHRIPAGKAAEIDLAAPLQFAPQRLDAADMALLGRSDEVVVADVEKPRHLA